jgi:methyl-accepting chemotaxis protein
MGEGRRRGLSIRVKVLAFLGLAMAMIFTVTTAVQVVRQSTEREALFEGRNQLFVQAQADAVMAAVWNFDAAVLRQQLKSLDRDPSFLGARIVEPGGRVMNSHGTLDRPEALALSAPVTHDGETIARIEIHFSKTHLDAAVWKDTQHLVLSGALTFVVVLAIAFAGLQLILVPLKQMRATMLALASGSLSIEVPALDRRDEVGEMAKTIQVFKDNAIRVRDLAQQEESARQAQDRRSRQLEDAIVMFERAIAQALSAVSRSTANLDDTAKTMTHTARATTERAATVAAAAHQATSNVQSAAMAARQLTSSIGEIGGQIAHSASIAQAAVGDADRANQMVQGLADAAQRIGEVVNLINGIAGQTNLLALNATIEAARRARRARASPWWRRRSRGWPTRPRGRPRTSPPKSTPSKRRPAKRWRSSSRSVGPSAQWTRSPGASRHPSASRGRRPNTSRSMCRKPPTARAR